jgi:hypothetical protein
MPPFPIIRIALAALLGASALHAAAPAPSPDQIPEWAQPGKFRFTRMDGGPIEVLKTSRSAWGSQFTPSQLDALGNLYTQNADRMLGLLDQAKINWVWLTWSVGYSWQDEAAQRAQCQRLIPQLRAHGIHTMAYACASSIFWESLFRDEPRSVGWIRYDPDGVPFRYSDGRDPLRFIADVRNPGWVQLVEKRVDAAIDAGFDALFLDNTALESWADNAAMETFIQEIRRHVREDRHSNLLLLTNFGLRPDRAALNRDMDMVFIEGFVEPGVWDGHWELSNIRRAKFARGFSPAWKPLTTEYSIFHEGNRSSTWLSPRSAKLATAEAATLQSDYSWDMEGPFLGALMAGDDRAMATWRAIARYSAFLRTHEDLYWRARQVAPVLVLRSAHGAALSSATENTGIFDFLAAKSVLFDIKPAGSVDEPDARRYRAIIAPEGVELPSWLRDDRRLVVASHGDASLLQAIDALTSDAPALEVSGAPHVWANVTRLDGKGGMAVHLVNYDPQPVSGVRIRLKLGREFAEFARASAVLLTPDEGTALSPPSRGNDSIEFTLDRLDTYSVVVLKP